MPPKKRKQPTPEPIEYPPVVQVGGTVWNLDRITLIKHGYWDGGWKIYISGDGENETIHFNTEGDCKDAFDHMSKLMHAKLLLV